RALSKRTRSQTQNHPAANQSARISRLRRPFSQHAAPGRAGVERARARRLRIRKKSRRQPRGRAIGQISSHTTDEEKRLIALQEVYAVGVQFAVPPSLSNSPILIGPCRTADVLPAVVSCRDRYENGI